MFSFTLSVVLILVCSVPFLFITVIAEANDVTPLWIKTPVSWWLNGLITDIELLNGIVFLIGNNIIELSETEKKLMSFPTSSSVLDSDHGNFIIYYMDIENYGPGPYSGRIVSADPYAKDIQPQTIEVWLHQTQYFEKQIKYLNTHFQLPDNVYIGLGECQQKDAYYNKNTSSIVICYELIFDIYDKFLVEYEPEGFTKNQITVMTLDVIDYVFYHQLAHALLHKYNLPITDSDEQIVDSLSNYIRMSIPNTSEQKSISNTSLWFKIMNEAKNIESSHMWNTHSLNLERFSDMACDVSELNSVITSYFIHKGFISNEEVVTCKIEYIQQKNQWASILEPFLK